VYAWAKNICFATSQLMYKTFARRLSVILGTCYCIVMSITAKNH
jgi:hypothetical protein